MADGKPHFEFLGPHGPLGIILALPLVCYGLVFACNSQGCLHLVPHFSLPGFPEGQAFFSLEALAVFLGWFGLLVILHLLLPGERAQGTVLPDGSRLKYKLNGALEPPTLLPAAEVACPLSG
jgi:delta14-sterol reductase